MCAYMANNPDIPKATLKALSRHPGTGSSWSPLAPRLARIMMIPDTSIGHISGLIVCISCANTNTDTHPKMEIRMVRATLEMYNHLWNPLAK